MDLFPGFLSVIVVGRAVAYKFVYQTEGSSGQSLRSGQDQDLSRDKIIAVVFFLLLRE